MTQFNFLFDPNVSLEQRIGFEMAASIWSTFLLDDVTINLRIGATDGLNNDKAVGGAIPIFHKQHYGVYREYLERDATSAEDSEANASLQRGNTVDVLIDGEVIDGNTTIMLTSAQAKALGMSNPLALGDDDDDDDDDEDDKDYDANDNTDYNYDANDNDDDANDNDDGGSTWDRDLVSADALDGYIVLNNSYDWNYDFAREAEAPEDTLDFLTMALHEVGHTLGFVSGLDGLLDTFQLHSGETQAEGFTALDMFRHTIDSQALTNPDGEVADLTLGSNAYFALDGKTTLATFSTGHNTEAGGDGYQASHWERFQQALGIMDPTLGYQERTNISRLDLQAFDALGWDINYAALEQGIDFQALHVQARQAIADDFSVGVTAIETAVANGQDWYTLVNGSAWQAFKDQMIELGWGSWWQEFEDAMLKLGWGSWWQAFDQPILELGWGSWWQIFEEQVLELGWGSWWQEFESNMLELGWGSWWQQFEPQMLELGWGGWWQVFEEQMVALGWGSWWQEFESALLDLGWGSWWQAFEADVLELGWGSWWQIFEDKVLDLGWGSWWQEFESDMLELGWGSWWQAFELNNEAWWQQIEQHLDTLKASENATSEVNPNAASVVVSGGSADDILGGIAKDLISGGAGDDLLDGKDSDDILLGDKGNDIIYGWTGEDILFGGDGDDLLSGENGNDQLFGETGADILSGGRGEDVLDGGEGRDVLKGDIDNDVLVGGAGDDRLNGGSGADLLVGGTGEDIVDGGDDDDVLYGDDYFVPVAPATSADNAASNNSLAANLTSDTDLASGATLAAAQDFWLRLEAENFKLRNYNKKKLSDASGGKVIATRGDGEAWTTFSGPTGTYDLVVGYYDKAKGAAEITLIIQRQGSGDTDGRDDTAPDNTTYTWNLEGATGKGNYQISGVALAPGDRILLKGDRDGKDFARVDYIDVLTSGATHSSDTTDTPTKEAYTFVGGNNGEGQIIRVEAESLKLSGDYTPLTDLNASDDAIIAATENTPGTATFTYTGQSSVYNLYANYFDSSAGNAQAEVFLNGVSLTSWEFNLDDDAAHEQTLGVEVTLNPGDVIQIQGEAGLSTSVANLVTNGGFENNSISANSWGLVNSLPGWSPTVQSVIEVQELSNWFGNADEGGAWLELDSTGNGGVAQTLSTNAQADYQLSFAYSPRPGVASASNGIAVYWDGQLLDTISRLGGNQNNWQTYTYDVTASGGNTTLEFRAIGNSDGIGAFLDDVKVQSLSAADQAIIDYLVLEQVPNTVDHETSSSDISVSSPNQLSLFNGVHADALTGVFNFDGNNDYGELTGAETGGAMTFSAWVNYDSFNHWSRIFDFGDGAAQNNILLANEGKTNNLVFEVHAGGAKHRLTIGDFWRANTWMHITTTLEESGRMRIYKDGVLAGETISSVIPNLKSRTHNYIGKSHWSNDGYFEGQLKDVELLNEALDEAAVQALYSGESQGGNVNVDATTNQPLEAVTLRLEAENMDLSGSAQGVSQSFASGGQFVRTGTTTNTITTYESVYVSGGGDDDDDDDGYWTTRPVYTTETTATGVQFSSTSLFSGETGAYDITVGYYDENDGAAEIIVKVGNQEIDRWFTNQNLGSSSPTASTFTTRTVAQGLQISNLDLIEIIAIGDNGDQANLDYIEFIKAAELPTQAASVAPPPSFASLLGNNDVLRGGAGNDTAYGGVGDDIVYGDAGNDALYGDFATVADYSLQNGVHVDAATGELDFDGNDDYAELTGVETGGAMTFSAWVNYDSFNHWSRIFDFGDGAANNNILLANKQGTNTLGLHIFEGSQTVGVLEIENFWQTDTWIHVTATIDDSGAIRVYKNGTLAGEAVSSVVPTSKVRAHNYIGKSHWSNDGAFDGQLNDVALLKEALSEEAVQALHNTALLDFGGEIYDGSRYLLTDSAMTWEDAQAYAASLGGNLVTINDANEEAWLKSTFGMTEGFWIGINDRLVEGQFEWVSGEAVTYSNWAPGEPNNSGGNQDYGYINYGGAKQWDDASSPYQKRGIIELKLTPKPGGGNDGLIGGSGYDTLFGGEGNDILNGTDENAKGELEQDTLIGGIGADQFILGDANHAYYSTGGDFDYVVITDFTAGVDTVQLHGSAADYQQSSQAAGVFLYHGSNQDLVAQFENITALNLSSNATFI